MRLSWAEIRLRAAAFARDWDGQGYERGQTQLFYRDFFEVFGIPVRRVASFEARVNTLGDRRGFIDCFWPGVLLIEQKSAGRDLRPAKQQALDYFPGLTNAQLPRFLLVSDFQTFELYDLEDGGEWRFTLDALPDHVELFGFMIGVERRPFREQDPVNVEVAAKVGALHDALQAAGYRGRELEQLLVRIVFCLFADDTGIFSPRGIFHDLIADRTADDGRDLGSWLARLFQLLDTPEAERPAGEDPDLLQFPYVNGALFRDTLRIPTFDAAMRRRLLDASEADWTGISPAIFGTLFQSVMEPAERRAQGAHYTTEKNILKVVEPLFMDDLRARFTVLKDRRDTGRRAALQAFQRQLASLRIFDPACGAGNFLIVAYRELRLLELDVVRELRTGRTASQLELDAADLSLVDVDQFFGIEIDLFAGRIAETAMWMMDHLMNNRLSLEFGQSFVRIPLRRSARIVHGNALEVDWNSVLPAAECTHILGNPPFRGHQWRSPEQQGDMHRVWGRDGAVNRLDYVTCWFRKAVDYARPNAKIEIAFVATNSITQGEQVGILWPALFADGARIRFAHRTFRWSSEAPGSAAVHCVIVGLAFDDRGPKRIYDYDDVKGDPHVADVSRINGYLIDAPNHALPARTQPPPGRLKLFQGSKPADGARLRIDGRLVTTSNLILKDEDRASLVTSDPAAAKWLRPYVGTDELVSGRWRWCLWLKDADPAELSRSPAILERLDRVRRGREQSPTASVRDFARFPTLFTQDRQPSVAYLAIPEVSSETREYIPMAMLGPEVIASNKLLLMPGADLFYFGVLTSKMHMAWTRVVAGRLKSDYSYSPTVYNSFPWPEATEVQRARIIALAQGVLDARTAFAGSTLEVLYDPATMPPALRRAHDALDTAIDRLYRRAPFRFERERVEFLFERFDEAATPLAPTPAAPARRRASSRRRSP